MIAVYVGAGVLGVALLLFLWKIVKQGRPDGTLRTLTIRTGALASGCTAGMLIAVQEDWASWVSVAGIAVLSVSYVLRFGGKWLWAIGVLLLTVAAGRRAETWPGFLVYCTAVELI